MHEKFFITAFVLMACSGPPRKTSSCLTLEAHIRNIYQQDSEYLAIEVEDNVQMVLLDCQQSPTIGACIQKADTIPTLHDCLIPVDEKGTEGEKF